MVIRKAIVIAMLSMVASSEVLAAENVKVSVGGYLDTQMGLVSQRKPFDQKNPVDATAGKFSNYGVTNDTKIDIKIDAESKYGFKYGGGIRINADTSIDASGDDDTVADRTYIYVASKYGRLEGGAYKSISAQMQVSANSVATVSGGIDGYAPKWINQNMLNGNSISGRFVKWPELLTNCDCVSFANKVTYITPKLAGLQAGVSYTPDIAVHGTVARLSVTPKSADKDYKDYKDLFDFAVTYENKFKDFSYQVGATAQHAKSKSLTPALARKDMNVYEVGAVVGYKDFSVAGSFSDWGKSSTPVMKDPNKKYGAKYWTAGAAYQYDKLRSSLTYFKGYRANVFSAGIPATTLGHDVSHNKNYYVSLGMDYALAPGFMPYAEYTYLDFKNADGARGNRANVLLLGTRLTF